MGKYHKQENQHIHRPKGTVWHLLYRTNIQTAKPNPLPKNRTPRSPCHVWTPPISHLALSEEAHPDAVSILTNQGCAL